MFLCLTGKLHIVAYLALHLVPHNRFLGQGIGLRGKLIARRLVRQGLHELVGKDLDVRPLIAVERTRRFLLRFDGLDGDVGPALVGVVVLLGDDDGGVGVSSEDALIPHEVIVDELAG